MTKASTACMIRSTFDVPGGSEVGERGTLDQGAINPAGAAAVDIPDTQAIAVLAVVGAVGKAVMLSLRVFQHEAKPDPFTGAPPSAQLEVISSRFATKRSVGLQMIGAAVPSGPVPPKSGPRSRNLMAW